MAEKGMSKIGVWAMGPGMMSVAVDRCAGDVILRPDINGRTTEDAFS